MIATKRYASKIFGSPAATIIGVEKNGTKGAYAVFSMSLETNVENPRIVRCFYRTRNPNIKRLREFCGDVVTFGNEPMQQPDNKPSAKMNMVLTYMIALQTKAVNDQCGYLTTEDKELLHNIVAKMDKNIYLHLSKSRVQIAREEAKKRMSHLSQCNKNSRKFVLNASKAIISPHRR